MIARLRIAGLGDERAFHACDEIGLHPERDADSRAACQVAATEEDAIIHAVEARGPIVVPTDWIPLHTALQAAVGTTGRGVGDSPAALIQGPVEHRALRERQLAEKN